jgi:hypothetical protein
VKRSTLRRDVDFDRTHLDSDVDTTRRQIAEWADQAIETNARFMTNRSLTTDGCMVYLLFASIALALVLLLQSAPSE